MLEPIRLALSARAATWTEHVLSLRWDLFVVVEEEARLTGRRRALDDDGAFAF